MNRLPRVPWFALLTLLAILSPVRAETELVRLSRPSASPGEPVPVGSSAPASAHSDSIDLFGHQTPSLAGKAEAVLPEGQREIRHPDASTGPVKGGTSETRMIDRRARESSAWRFSDLLPLAAVLGLIAGVGLIIRRYMPAKGLLGGSSGLLEVVARAPVSPKQSVVLVRVARRFLLLGVSPDRITTLCVLDDEQSSAELMTEMVSRRPDSSSQVFQNSFSAESAEFEAEEEEDGDPAGAATGHVRGLLEKVRQLKRGRVA